jgi:hypothetical protein
MLKIAQLTLMLLTAATLVACGGGSSDPSSSQPPASTTLATAKYLGTWNSICDGDDITVNGSTGSNVISSFEFTANTATTFSGTLKTKVYARADITCSTLIATLSQAVAVTVDSAGSGAGGSDKVTLVIQNSAISGSTVTISSGSNTVVYPNGRTLGTTDKDILLASATTLRYGEDSALDANGYPLALDTNINGFLTKQ